MAQTEEKIVKIVDTDVHTRGASVVQEGSYGALVVRSIESEPTSTTQLNASYTLSNEDNIIASTMYLTKTIDGIDYRRELRYNSEGDLLEITSWEKII
ncbi:MAG TPA: hypothetical protein PLT50_04360 [bacterium]|nr:hypothetical protein [bacterium]